MPIQTPARDEAIHVAYQTAARILSARALLGIALIGAFVLAVMAVIRSDILSIVALGLYACLTILPIVALEFRTRR